MPKRKKGKKTARSVAAKSMLKGDIYPNMGAVIKSFGEREATRAKGPEDILPALSSTPTLRNYFDDLVAMQDLWLQEEIPGSRREVDPANKDRSGQPGTPPMHPFDFLKLLAGDRGKEWDWKGYEPEFEVERMPTGPDGEGRVVIDKRLSHVIPKGRHKKAKARVLEMLKNYGAGQGGLPGWMREDEARAAFDAEKFQFHDEPKHTPTAARWQYSREGRRQAATQESMVDMLKKLGAEGYTTRVLGGAGKGEDLWRRGGEFDWHGEGPSITPEEWKQRTPEERKQR